MKPSKRSIVTEKELQLLSNNQHGTIVRVNNASGNGIPFKELVAGSTERNRDTGRAAHTERTRIALYHNHLPKLAEQSVIEQDDGLVKRGPAFEEVKTVLTAVQNSSETLTTTPASE